LATKEFPEQSDLVLRRRTGSDLWKGIGWREELGGRFADSQAFGGVGKVQRATQASILLAQPDTFLPGFIELPEKGSGQILCVRFFNHAGRCVSPSWSRSITIA